MRSRRPQPPGISMKQATSIALAWPTILFAACLLQGCGGGGGDAEPDAATAAGARLPQSATGADTALADPLSLSPVSGPPGSSVAAFGEGFQGRCGIDLFLDTVANVLGAAEVKTDGTYSTQVIVPEDTASGPHTVLVRGRNLVGELCTEPVTTTAEETFTVTARIPVISLQTLEGRPGLTAEVRGRGFCAESACSAVTILIDGQVAASDVTVDADGTFVTDAAVPAISAAGSVAVTALQRDAGGLESRAFGELIVTVRPNQPRPVIN